MKLIKCENGHFYDGDKYPECPYCNTELLKDHSIVHAGAAEQPGPAAQAAAPAGPVAGWLVVLDGPARGRDLRLGVGRSFLGLDGDGTPVTLSADAPLSARQAAVAYDAEKNAFTLLPFGTDVPLKGACELIYSISPSNSSKSPISSSFSRA